MEEEFGVNGRNGLLGSEMNRKVREKAGLINMVVSVDLMSFDVFFEKKSVLLGKRLRV